MFATDPLRISLKEWKIPKKCCFMLLLLFTLLTLIWAGSRVSRSVSNQIISFTDGTLKMKSLTNGTLKMNSLTNGTLKMITVANRSFKNPTQPHGRLDNAAGQPLSFHQSSCAVLRVLKIGVRRQKPFGARIPKIFHQTYKNTKLPIEYKQYIAGCRKLNPDWQYYLWRDEDIEAFMAEHFPSYSQKYRKFSMNVQRADFIRYMVLYHYGGIYLDMDVECIKPFFPSLEDHLAFIDQERKEHAHILSNQEFVAMNSAMGSVVGHPFYLRMLQSVVDADDKLVGAGITTGPDRLTIVYREWAGNSECMRDYPVTLMDPVVFSPLVDVKTHKFKDRCHRVGKDHWRKVGCKLMDAKDWKVDGTDNVRTVAKHQFLHLGYSWGPKSRTNFEALELGPVKLYKIHRMQN